MSRVGKKPISIEPNTDVEIIDGLLTVKGKGGQISRRFKSDITIKVENKTVVLAPVKQTLFTKALWGTYASHISNMIKGVNKPFEKKLLIEGIGYRAELTGNQLVMSLGFSHPVIMDIPEDLKLTVDKEGITIRGVDKEKVGQFAAKIRDQKKPEPYKGKGIRYSDEVIRRKQGKKSA